MWSHLCMAEAQEHINANQDPHDAIYYSSLTFHRITALYVKHSPSMLAVTYGGSGPACE